ncbi:hypothetical protein CHU92_02955 [Flavobacterium cyanobacteriorum]|uniref:Uncharacterized protein n=1 Tax=Flavobacterium cyanobacteriorum TaxID=2022802 RepID=A0A255ZSA5_9FLAO|nr:hypothetical protein [Flavobacterium cyanobacteriorum]OYQ43804.1 hypothetical protein CHU92_02955 [Flavobacterium cyanobacteriorum]
MKIKIFFLFLISCCVACKNNAGDENYIKQPVGMLKGGQYVVTNSEKIKQEWETALNKTSDNDKIKTFTIIKATTEGDIAESYYILIGTNASGTAKTAAMLYLDRDKFYFEKQQGSDALSYLTIVCEGKCDTGCNPIVKISGDSKFLVCSSCIDCIKTENELR